eukprot:16428315-Heterocapsa_arctica.AAC.1
MTRGRRPKERSASVSPGVRRPPGGPANCPGQMTGGRRPKERSASVPPRLAHPLPSLRRFC